MQKKLVFKNQAEPEQVTQLSRSLHLHPIIAALLVQRGLGALDEAQRFLKPSVDRLENPLSMLGMARAVERIEQAVSGNENILLYGDYDVDGTSAVALMRSYLTRTCPRIEHYIPDRYLEGYGVSDAGIDFAIDNNFSLVITLDCGIKAVKKIRRAKEAGVDFIICDHHTPDEILPDAIILNPKQKECPYPYKELSGCGIGFKLVQALNKTRGGSPAEILDLLDLVAISIAADIVPIRGENRLLATAGLERMNNFPLRPGIKRTLDLAGKRLPVTVEDIVFGIAPRINAAGRIESGNRAVDLLTEEDENIVRDIADQIELYNTTRKQLDGQMTAEALHLVENDAWFSGSRSTVVFKPDWHKGVVGIVASRLMETHYKPTIVLTESNGMAVGSARSVRGFNVYNAIEQCADLLEQFGGHFYAAGLTMPLENLSAFRKKFDEVVSQSISDEQEIPTLEIDAELNFDDLFGHNENGLPEFYRNLKKLAPFGPENMNPVFISRNVRDTGYATVLKEQHLKMSLMQEGERQIVLPAIAFGMAEKFDPIRGRRFDVVYTLSENVWNGRSTLQLMVKEIVVNH